MTMNTTFIRLFTKTALATAILFGSISNTFAENYKIIANKSVPSSSLTKQDLNAIFLGEKSRWSDGKPIKFVVLEESDAHQAFLRNIVGKTSSQFDCYWKKLVFTGKASMPKSFSESSEIIDYVAGHSGYIAYVDQNQPIGSTKTISIKKETN